MRVKPSYKDKDFSLSHSLDTAPDPAQFRMHTHTTTEIYCFVKGQGIFHIEGNSYPLESGDLLIMKPSESHYIALDCSQPYERIVLNFNTEYLQQIDPEGQLLTPILNRKSGKHNLYKGYEFRAGNCFHYFESMESPIGNQRINILSALFPLLNELYGIYSSRTEDPEEGVDPLPHRIIRYINKNLSSPIRLETICQKFYISKSQLCRMFKSTTGTTVWQYITIKRLVKAQQLLHAGESATHIYAQCGFSDYSSFYRAYNKHYGYPPSKEQTDSRR